MMYISISEMRKPVGFVCFKCPLGNDYETFYGLGIPVYMLTVNDQGIIHILLDVYNARLGENWR